MSPHPLRVLVAEDSPTARRLLVEILRADPAFEVVGEARDGVEALELVHRLRPDLVTMDLHMPRMDGLEATRRILQEVPTPVVVVSTLVERDIHSAMAALRAGALAVLQKLVGPQAPHFEEESQRLRSTLRALATVRVVRRRSEREASQGPGVLQPAGRRRVEVVAIAASTGGPAALHRVLSALPASFPVPVLVVQHIALGFAAGLATWLDGASPLRVRVAEPGELLRPGAVLLAPDDRHLGVGPEGRVHVSQEPPMEGFRPSANLLFRSVARAFGGAAVCVVLTGMGEDGVRGLREVHEAGGWVVAQDEESCVVYGMPGAAVAAGLVDEVLPLEGVAPRLQALAELGAGGR